MKKWEDSIKDRLEGYESPLPEGSLAEFRALREGKEAGPARKAAPWIWGLTAAIAAGLAAVLLLRQRETPVDGIQIIEHPTTPVAAIIDSSDVTEQLPSPQLIAQAVTSRGARQVSIQTREVIPNDESEAAVDTASEEEAASVQVPETNADSANGETASTPEERTASPFIPESAEPRITLASKVAPTAGLVAGSGLLATVLMPVLKTGTMDEVTPSGDQISPFKYGIGTDYTTGDQLFVAPRHAFPLRLGLSTRIPLADRLYLSTGVQYSLYSSSFTYAFSGEKKQKVHYLGVPVRLDWVFASGRLFDVYVGAGMQGDICVGATMAGEPFTKDAPSLSLLGAGGIQMKVTRHLGIYAEPELSWRIPSEKHVLQTYRSEHPLMFSVAAGLRIDMGK